MARWEEKSVHPAGGQCRGSTRNESLALLERCLAPAQLSGDQAHQFLDGEIIRHLLNVGKPDLFHLAVRIAVFLRDERDADENPLLPVFQTDRPPVMPLSSSSTSPCMVPLFQESDTGRM